MKRLMLLSALPIVLSGCALVNQAKLHSQDETVWRGALEEIAQTSPSSYDRDRYKGGHIRHDSELIYAIASDKSYHLEVRKAAIVKLRERGEYESLLGLYDPPTTVTDAELKKSIAAAFNTVEGISALIRAQHQNEYGDSYCKKSAYVIFENNVKNGQLVEQAWCKVCKYCLEHPDTKWSWDKDDDSGYDMHGESGYKFAIYCYRRILNPSVDLAKKMLWNNELVDFKNSRSVVLDSVLGKIPTKDLREYLPKMREKNPDKYWRIWSYCATSEEALNVWNTNTDPVKRMYAIGRVTDEKVLENAINETLSQMAERGSEKKDVAGTDGGMAAFGAFLGNMEKLQKYGSFRRTAGETIKRALGGFRNYGKLLSYVQDARFEKEYKEEACHCIVSLVCREPSKEGLEALERSVGLFDYSEDFGRVFAYALDATKSSGNSKLTARFREAFAYRADEIKKDGLSVSKDTIVCEGFRNGMYKWEFEFLYAFVGLTGIGRCHDGKFCEGECESYSDSGFVTSISYSGAALKKFFGVDATSSPAVAKDVISDKHGNPGKYCKWEISQKTGGDSKLVVLNVGLSGIYIPPRYSGRKPNAYEEKILRDDWIREDGVCKGTFDDFFSGKYKPRKGLAYGYEPNIFFTDQASWAIVMDVNKEGIVVGRKPITEEKKIRRKVSSGHFLDPPKIVEEIQRNVTEFPVKLFLKIKGDFAVGEKCPSGKFRCVGTVKIGDESLFAFEPYVAPKK